MALGSGRSCTVVVSVTAVKKDMKIAVHIPSLAKLSKQLWLVGTNPVGVLCAAVAFGVQPCR